MKKLVLVGLVSALLVGCTIADKETRVSSPVQGMVYNSVMSKYTPMPTAVSLSTYGNDQELAYRTDGYGFNQYGSKEQVVLFIPKNNAVEHEKILNKFLEWDNLAKSRGDQITKMIGSAKTVKGNMIYTFHSGNEYVNVLSACFDVLTSSVCGVNPVAFDRKNVEYLLKDIQKLKLGGFQHSDLSVYQ